jgi:hypothetical protein
MQTIGRGISKNRLFDILWYNGRLDNGVKINDCKTGYELEITTKDPGEIQLIRGRLVQLANQYTNVIIKGQ